MINPMSVEERRAYYLKSLEVIESDEEIKEYEDGLNFKKNFLTVISINTNVFRVLLHPIRFCRAEKELRRLEDIKVEFNALKKEQLPTLFVEESGDLREDFSAEIVSLDIAEKEKKDTRSIIAAIIICTDIVLIVELLCKTMMLENPSFSLFSIICLSICGMALGAQSWLSRYRFMDRVIKLHKEQ